MSQDSECVCDTCASENNYDTPEARAYWTRKRVFLAWAEALRSGGYRQWTGGLRTHLGEGEGEGFCCLGVLCDLGGSKAWKRLVRTYTFHGFLTGVLPHQVQYRAHIAVDEQDALIHMNDTQGYSFDQIAEVLEVAANQGISIHAALGLIEGAASDA